MTTSPQAATSTASPSPRASLSPTMGPTSTSSTTSSWRVPGPWPPTTPQILIPRARLTSTKARSRSLYRPDLDRSLDGAGVEWDDDGFASVPYDYDVTIPPPGVFDIAGRADMLPAWATSWSAAHQLVTRKLSNLWFLARFHTAHSPAYALRLVQWSPRGLGRAAGAVIRWAADAEAKDALQALTYAVSAGGSGGAHLVHERRAHRQAIRYRLGLVAVALTILAIGWLWLLAQPIGVQAAVAVAAVAGFGFAGRPPGRTFTDRAISVDRPERLSWDLIEEAFRGLGISGLNKAFAEADRTGAPVMIHKVTPIKEVATGWTVEIDLPRGVTVEMIAKQRAELASGLRRPVACVFVEHSSAQDAHQARLSLFVATKPLRQIRARQWPLQESGRTSMFEPIPLGIDSRGRPVTATMFENSVLIGSLPAWARPKPRSSSG